MTKRKSSTEAINARGQRFLTKSKEQHGDTYDYSLVEYVDTETPVKIICPVHGITLQKPKDHVRSQTGCQRCGMDRMAGNMRLSWDTVLERFRAAHGSKYTYDNSNYIGMFKPIVVTCPDHGDFNILPSNHVEGQGCVKCHRAKFPAKNGQSEKTVRRSCERLVHEETNRPDFSKLHAWRPTVK